ncbi:MAG: chlororespiratory reduction protein 7 [Synechococcales cyanobacterium C42_A2020_086]|jgi:hypothetical protein|nr:chlororespiratory reduction protein 7 [Synechococcales cyanobacterium M58_A2018_015]MBF2075606.1 chlororespiratory reduction protein 7 [Synechococcales cyanobacterium C42_A2020_086]
MADSIMYQEDAFVVLEPNQPEQILSAAELLDKLKGILSQRQDDLPADLQALNSVEAQAQSLIDTVCELDLGPGEFLQWYVIRLEKGR